MCVRLAGPAGCRRRGRSDQGNSAYVATCPACLTPESLLFSTCAAPDCSEVVAECSTGCHLDDNWSALVDSPG